MQLTDKLQHLTMMFWPHPTPQPNEEPICHNAKDDWVLPDPYLLASVGTDKVQQALLSGTPVFLAGHVNSVAIQAKKVDTNWFLIA